MSLEIGKKAPSFKLQGSDNKQHSLSEFAGEFVVLYFYPKDDTPGCTKEACGFASQSTSESTVPYTIVGVSPDEPASHQKFQQKYSLPFLLLSDPSRAMMKKYGAWGKKILYGKTTEGCIRSTVIIDPKGKVIKHWARVPDAAKHPAKVAEFMASLAHEHSTSQNE